MNEWESHTIYNEDTNNVRPVNISTNYLQSQVQSLLYWAFMISYHLDSTYFTSLLSQYPSLYSLYSTE